MHSEFQRLPINNKFPWRQKKNFQMNSANQMTSAFFPNDLWKQCYRWLLCRKRNNINNSVHSDVTENDPWSTIFRTFFPLFKLVYWKQHFNLNLKRFIDMFFNQIGLLIATLLNKKNALAMLEINTYARRSFFITNFAHFWPSTILRNPISLSLPKCIIQKLLNLMS